MIDFYELFSSSLARFVISPLLTIFLGNALKLVCQDSRMKAPWRNYFYCGPNAIAAAFLVTLIYMCTKIAVLSNDNIVTLSKEQLNNIILLFLVFIFAPILMANLLSKYGWEKDEYGFHIRKWRGIVLSNVIGFVVLYIVFSLLK